MTEPEDTEAALTWVSDEIRRRERGSASATSLYGVVQNQANANHLRTILAALSTAHAERDAAREALAALIKSTDAQAKEEAFVLVPRKPSRKLIEDLATEWAYDTEEACESYQGFLDVVGRHGLSGSDPSAYEDQTA